VCTCTWNKNNIFFSQSTGTDSGEIEEEVSVQAEEAGATDVGNGRATCCAGMIKYIKVK
jgi:hypothetical protein